MKIKMRMHQIALYGATFIKLGLLHCSQNSPHPNSFLSQKKPESVAGDCPDTSLLTILTPCDCVRGISRKYSAVTGSEAPDSESIIWKAEGDWGSNYFLLNSFCTTLHHTVTTYRKYKESLLIIHVSFCILSQ